MNPSNAPSPKPDALLAELRAIDGGTSPAGTMSFQEAVTRFRTIFPALIRRLEEHAARIQAFEQLRSAAFKICEQRVQAERDKVADLERRLAQAQEETRHQYQAWSDLTGEYTDLEEKLARRVALLRESMLRLKRLARKNAP